MQQMVHAPIGYPTQEASALSHWASNWCLPAHHCPGLPPPLHTIAVWGVLAGPTVGGAVQQREVRCAEGRMGQKHRYINIHMPRASKLWTSS